VEIDGGRSERYSLQLPVRADAVVGDARPFVSPLVDIADRGASTGVILASSEIVRLLKIEQGEVAEPADSTFELTIGDWRPFGGSAGGSPGRGRQTISHRERFEARVDAQRHHMFEDAVRQTARRLHDLGWERVVLVCEREIASRFRQTLPAELADRVIAETDVNLVGEEPPVIADALEPLLHGSWLARTTALVDSACERSRAGGAAALGPEETSGALAEGRVEHLLLDPQHDFSGAAESVHPEIGGQAEMIGERSVEAAVATGARVTSVSGDDSPALREAGGIAALLRY